MAASLGKNARLTLTAKKWIFYNINQRSISTCQVCCGSTWHVHDKPSRLKEIYKAPVTDEQFSGRGDVKDIIIPDKIERSPTSILEALASTVKNNINQPIYKSIDDPHLYMSTDRQKKQHMAAMDSGQKTAQLMISMYPDYFTQIWNEPVHDSYRDAHLGYKIKDPSEEALLERIAKLAVEDAISVYNSLKASNKLPSQETQEKLLELLAAFNCQTQESVSDLSSYVNSLLLSKNAPFPVSSWTKGNMAEQVFESLPEKTATAYNNMVRGMAKNYDKQGALDMFNQMRAENLEVDVYTYNLLLDVASLDAQTMDDVQQYIEIILRDMVSSNVRPNLGTFNSILSNCRRLSRWYGSKNFALSTLSEMKACGIEPSLGTYEQVIGVFYYHKDLSHKTPFLLERIMDEIEGKEFECKSEMDVLFFRKAMRAIAVHFPDSKYALRLHKILQHGKNINLLGHRQLQYAYYSDLFSVITPLEHIDVVMEIYTSVVPFIYAPSSDVYISILESIQMYDTYGYIPQLYTDVQYSSMFFNQNFVHIFMRLLSKVKNDSKLQGQLCNIATSVLNKWKETRNMQLHNKPYMDGTVIGDIMITFLNNDQPDIAWKLFKLYKDDPLLRTGDPSEEALSRLMERMIDDKDYASSKELLNLMHHLDYHTGLAALVQKLLQAFDLSDQERNYLNGLVSDSLTSSNSLTSSKSS